MESVFMVGRWPKQCIVFHFIIVLLQWRRYLWGTEAFSASNFSGLLYRIKVVIRNCRRMGIEYFESIVFWKSVLCKAVTQTPCSWILVDTTRGKTMPPRPNSWRLAMLSTTSPDWNCQWGPYSLYPRHVRASMLPKKETISTHTMHFKWHHRNLSKNDHESLERKRIMNNHKLLY